MFRICFRMSTAVKQAQAETPTGKCVLVDKYKNFSKVTLNNPRIHNCVNLQMVQQLAQELPALDKTKAFWLQGTGEKAFCAGADVKSLYFARQKNPKLLEDYFKNEFQLDYKLTKMKSLQISNWDGYVMGAGVGLSVFSPYRIATQNTSLAMVQNKIGFFTDAYGGYFLSRLRNNIGYYLGLTGMMLKGEEVYKAGIANYYVSQTDIPKLFEDLKKQVANSMQPKQTIDDVLSRYNKAPDNRVIEHEEDIRYIFNSRSLDEVFDKLNQNKTPFYAKIKQAMEQQCPISVHVTFKNIQMSRNMTAKDCFINDYAISQRFMQGNDFFEGVRCMLIDKNAKPKWSHKSIYEVPESDVNKFFEELPPSKALVL